MHEYVYTIMEFYYSWDCVISETHDFLEYWKFYIFVILHIQNLWISVPLEF